jgi:flavorubredoxin
MKAQEIKPGIYWVGARDWNVRNFHGYLTQRGTTYNAYLIIDDKITLVDNVKADFTDELIERISSVIDPSKIDVIVTNHIEADHTGSLPEILKLAPNAEIIASPVGKKGLIDMYGIDEEKITAVKSMEEISIGKNRLKFIHMGMVHWPDSMLTYAEDAKLLMTNDAFGQHFCSSHLFSDEVSSEDLFYETAKYYANIVLPYGAQVRKAIDAVGGLDFDMIAPSHGLIWRDQMSELIEKYSFWAFYKNSKRAVVVYDTMWKSTEAIAREIVAEFEAAKIPVTLLNLSTNHYSDVMSEVLEAKYVAIGSPSLNGEIMPSMAAFSTYMKGLKPQNKTGMAFGSYGWKKKFLADIEDIIAGLKWNVPVESFIIKGAAKEVDFMRLRESIKTIIN